MIDDLDFIIFESDIDVFTSLLNYYIKQSILTEYNVDVNIVMEGAVKDTFKKIGNKAKDAWKWFLGILKKFCGLIQKLWDRINRCKMSKHIKKKFDELKTNYYRKKYDLPKQDGHIKDPDADIGKGHDGLTREAVLQYIDVENQTLKSWLFRYDDIDERVEIQIEFLTALDEVLDKYLHDTDYSMEMAVKELAEKTDIYRYNKRIHGPRGYAFTGIGWQHDTSLRLTDEKIREYKEKYNTDYEHKNIEKCRDIPFSEYIQKFQKLESDMADIDKLATKVSGILDDIIHSTKYKDDIVVGFGGAADHHYKAGVDGNEYQYNSISWQDTGERYNLTHNGGKHIESNGTDKTGKEFDLYHFKELTAELAYFQNYMNSIYHYMKIEYDAIIHIKSNSNES